MALTITLAPSDAGTLKRIGTLVDPQGVNLIVGGTSAGFSDGQYIDIIYIGYPTDVTFVPASGVKINTPSTLVLDGVFASARLVMVGPNEWDLSGKLKSLDSFLMPSSAIKPAPLATTTINDASAISQINFGSSLHHNTHYRIGTTADFTVNIKLDTVWSGTQNYYDNNFAPTTPGPMPIGGSCIIGKFSAGNIVLTPDAGVTINSPLSLTVNKLNGKITLIKVSANTWDVEGNLAAT